VLLFDIRVNFTFFKNINRFCNDGDLFDKIKLKGKFNEYSAAYIMKQILSAIYFCHYKNIVHRDIKAENFLIESTESHKHLDGKTYDLHNIRLTDFSSARTFKKSKNLTKKVGTVRLSINTQTLQLAILYCA